MGDTPVYKEYVAGLLAGVATVAIGHPFDTVKVLLLLLLLLLSLFASFSFISIQLDWIKLN